jgi:cell division protease FtsH
MSTVANRPQPPPVDDIEKSLDGFFSKIARRWKTILLWTLILGAVWFVVIPTAGLWGPFVPMALTIIFQLLFALMFIAVQFGMMFYLMGRPRIYWIYPGETGVGFKDYRGNPEVLEVASRVVTLLKGVKEFKTMGGQVTRGILLVGPPGTGKSYLGQCISTEAGVPFGYLSAPSIQGMFMGMDTLRVIMLYRKARGLALKYGGCILFIDEIDAIGRSRGGMAGGGGGMGMGMGGMMGSGSGGLNQLLTEMDPLPRQDSRIAKLKLRLGMKVKKPEIPLVITMGATNLAQSLDAALLRPGRFDRKIFVDYPDFDGRKEIISYYLEKVAHEDLDLDRLAQDTIGQSPAALKFIINEAVINAHFNGRSKMAYEDFSQALDAHESGLRHPIRSMLQEEKRSLAYHESGHAVAMLKLYKRRRVTRVTIIRHEGSLGFAATKAIQETYTSDRDELLAHLQVGLAARAAEELFLGTQLSGVSGDLQSATRLAAYYIGIYGMNGSLYSSAAFGDGSPDAGMKKEIEKLLREQFMKAKQLLDLNHELVVAVAESLLVRLELDGDDLIRIEEEVERRKRLGETVPKLPERAGSLNVLELLPPSGASTAAYRPEPEAKQ